MSQTQIDPTQFRATQRKDWDIAAQGWHDWQEVMIESTIGVSKRLVELAEIKPGDRVLDVAAGSGEPALTAARVVGPEGRIVATDISERMLAFGRFDAAVSRWGIIFEPDAEAAAGRVRGFLKPGAKMAISSWGSPDRVPMLALPMMTVMQRLNVPPPPPGTPGPLSRPTPEAISGLLEGGGFSDVEAEELEVEMEWESPEAFVRFLKEIAPPVSALIAPHPPEVQDETWAAIADAVRPSTASDGTLRLNNLALVAAGTA
jgi:enediyne biosynthesis protein CalE5